MNDLIIFLIYISGMVATFLLGFILNRTSENYTIPTHLAILLSIFSFMGFFAIIIGLVFAMIITTITNIFDYTSFDDWYRGIK